MDVKKNDMLLIPTSLLVIDHAQNGRFAPHTEEEIKRLAEDIALSSQKQPVGVKKIKGTDKYRLVFGFGRAQAVMYLNSLRDEDEQLPIKAISINESDREMFLSNIAENYFHKSPTDMDHAHNIRRAINDYGMTQAELAAKYGQSQSWISQRLALNDLNHDIQMKLHKGLITVSNAIEIAKTMTEEQQAEMSAKLNEIEQKVTKEVAEQVLKTPDHKQLKAAAEKKLASTVNKAAKDIVATKSTKKAEYKPASKRSLNGARSSSEVRDFLSEHMNPTKYSKKVQLVCSILLNGWDSKNGLREDSDFSKALVTAIDGAEKAHSAHTK